MKVEKPKKRVIIYWFVEQGFFFLIMALYVTGTFLKYLTFYRTLTVYVMTLTLLIIPLSLLYLLYKWAATEYIFLKNYLFLKEGAESTKIAYSDIKEVGYYASLLQHLTGTTNLRIKMKNNENHYIKGIKDYKKIENELLSRMK
ncbi:MAG: hypothetical protein JW791_00220 [Nanoarchaeota archaeon]|nr:hypothetical protein [Nanoarchaeota archaeon]